MAGYDTRTIKLRAIHALGRELGLDHKEINRVVRDGQFGTSLGKMSTPQLTDFVKWLRIKVAILHNKPKWDKQARKIFKLGFLLGWTTADLRKFFLRVLKNKNEIRQMNSQEKAFVIVGLQKVLEYKNACAKK